MMALARASKGGSSGRHRYRTGEIDTRLVGGDMGADLLDRAQVAVDDLQHDLGGEMEPHQAVAAVPIDVIATASPGLQAMVRRQGYR